MKKLLVTLLTMILCCGMLYAQNRKELNSVNMRKALESYKDDDYSTSMEYLVNELSDNEKNGYAYAYLSRICLMTEDYSNGLQCAEKAIKYLPSKDKEYIAFVYNTRAGIYQNINEIDKALKDYTKCISLIPDKRAFYSNRAELYFGLKQYDMADNDYRKMIDLDPSDYYAYMGLGRNAKEQGKYNEAIKYFDLVIQRTNDEYSSAYSFRAETYMMLQRFDDAANDAVKAFAIDGDQKAKYVIVELADSSLLSIASRLKVQCNKDPNQSIWPYYLGIVYANAKQYVKALEWFGKSYAMEADAITLNYIAECYCEIGMYKEALTAINKALEQDSTTVQYFMQRANIYYGMGDYDNAIKDMDASILLSPEFGWLYHRRGWFKEMKKDFEDAFDDYSASITLIPSYAYNYFTRGRCYERFGNKKAAERDYRKAIECDTNYTYPTCAQYANYHLGNLVEAERLNEKLINSKNDHYDVACFYSLLGQKEKALEFLKKSFENGWCEFNHLDVDEDMTFLRDMEEYRILVAEYKMKRQQENEKASKIFDDAIQGEEYVVEIPFTRRNGVTEVKCNINGLPLYFIFDTGAGDISISSVEANFMKKNGYLTEKDIIGKRNYMNANGEISEGMVINLSKVELGGFTINNVRASVVKNQNAPLLLGQSALSRFGIIEIDNAKQVLRIKYTK